MSWRVKCPAKLNLFLAVGPRDGRGWHPLRTRFQCIDLFDELTVEVAEVDSFKCNVEYLTSDNTITRAADLIRAEFDLPPLAIRLTKGIPAQSGLGGGSSDAAGLLRLVQRRLAPGIDDRTLHEIGFRCGADVPFFLVGGAATAEGYGEKLVPLPDALEQFFLVVKPEVDCSTPAMFRALDDISYAWKEFDPTLHLYNDFERVMPRLCREKIEHLLAFGAKEAGLSGSGSAVFGRFDSHTAAETAAELFKGSGQERVWVCRSLTRKDSLSF